MLTKDELKDFETKLMTRKEKIEANLDKTSTELDDIRELELNDEADFASISTNTAIDNAILEQQRHELSEIDLALDKIKKGIYGICEMCEEPIGKARLQVKNFARYCIVCREIVEKNKAKDNQ
ncbi:MAG: RNA polymerase-binding protein DksA [Sulfurovaceae bacterium]|nr:RNA polymerase-binding protein DksA [Sulfurovaceae bacterium]MDD5360356.1 RNA polymerase-binding protein DksA [Sulfurovaceae bacterium]MDD5548923.1 RNA polymerase-binding protein DksA [Sulfurovaceae bacterium]